MQHGQTPDRGELWPADEGGFFWDVESAEQQGDEVVLRPPASYRKAFGDEPIRVGIVEFQIMLFLSRWPYHAYTRRQIAEAVSSEAPPHTAKKPKYPNRAR